MGQPQVTSTGGRRPTLRFLQLTLAACLYLGSGLSSAETDPFGNSALARAVSEGRLTSWNNLLAHAHDLDESQQLAEVNSFVNRALSYGNDQDIWGAQEYWATPAEALARGRGDCEDFAIAKYFSLTRIGVPAERLRLTYVKALGRNQAHMVLAYYPAGQREPLILDSLDARIKPASQRRDLLPVFAFNSEGIYLAKAPQQKSRQSPTLLSRWNDVQDRALADGSLPALGHRI